MSKATNPKLLTLCIATFNRSDRVTQLIEEILSFDINDKIEILVIDDGSSDDTYEKILPFSKFENVSVYKNERNLGWSKTMIRYFNLCTTEFLVEVPDDDIIYKDGILDLLPMLLEHNADFICTRWIDVNREYYPGRGSDVWMEIPLAKIKSKTGHSPGCVYRTSLIKNAEPIILTKHKEKSSTINLYPQVILVLVAKLHGAKLLDSPILIGGYREEGPMISNLTDLEGNHYLSLPSAFSQHIFFEELYQELLTAFKDSQFANELKFMIKDHSLSFYNNIDDAVSLHSSTLAHYLRVGSARNFLNPLMGTRYFFQFLFHKIKKIFVGK